MGGMGSGRPGMWATVEGCRSLRLDVNAVIRRVREQLPAGAAVTVLRTGPIRWGWQVHGENAGIHYVLVTLELGEWDGSARLQYDITHSSRRTGPQDQTVDMEATPCRFGGRQWWWRCRATGRRCAKLYLPNGGVQFLSRGRGAYRLAYQSQRQTALDRSHERLGSIIRSLGAKYTHVDMPLPPRPKGMRHRTYEQVAERWDDWQAQHDQIWMRGAVKFLRKL